MSVARRPNPFSRSVPGVWVCAMTLGVLAGATCLAFPGIDLNVSRAFYVGAGGGFSGQSLGWVLLLRNIFVGVFFLCLAVAFAGLLSTRGRTRTWMRFTGAQWLFLAACLAIGPGVVANIVLKDHWGRARPKQVVEFGGTKTFTPALIPTDQCSSNCSFVSGEAASIFMPFFAVGLLIPQWSAVLLGAGTLFGLAAGLVRISQGAHFLSDVVFAGIFMAVTALIVHRAVFGRTPAAAAERSHDRGLVHRRQES
jgi:lipid A 4'-phosphatase